ncbi:MAG: SDR family NAD(P)-dependent oxidoreductase, partial [Planctomycetes bacterium]|nr:SDR family NAD(P)-dependent oxidoreductase [Planctomycetota bacterium]
MTGDELRGLFGLDGKVAVVTGAGGVLFSTVSKALGAVGVKLALLDIREDAAKAVAQEVEKAGGEAVGLACDVLKRDSIEAARDAVLERFGHVDILLNGAGG